MKDIPIDANVQCTDGKCGRSTYIIVNPVKQTVTHFVVKNKDLPENPDRLVPVDKIAQISGDVIQLNCSRAELAEMHPFTTTRFVQKGEPDYVTAYLAGDPNTFTHPMVAWDTWVDTVPEHHIPHDELAVFRGMTVRTGEGKVGQVDELVVDPDSGEITHLLMRRGHLWGKRDVAIPITAIDVVDADEVYLNIDNEEVKALPAVPVKRHAG
jgi:sporulation protein YlmC with PRC-barrel domain